MKQKIKIKVLTEGCTPVINEKGDWIDLIAAEDIKLDGPISEVLKKHGEERYRKVKFPTKLISLGVAMKLPKGMEAIVAPRSSSNRKFNIIQSNSFGIIDYTYSGPNDQWKMPVLATNNVNIKKGDRICQFRIQLSQKASVWQKLKWLFSNGVKIEIVKELNDPNRGGFGSTGIR